MRFLIVLSAISRVSRVLEIDGLDEKNREEKRKGILKMKASAIIAPDRIFGDVFSLYQISLDKYLDSIIIAAFAHFHPLLALVFSLLTQVLFF